jgi:AcrR family transcriptional regulator
MQNVSPGLSPSVATELAERAVRQRAAVYEEEVRRLLDAAYAVLRRTGELEPRVSDVVREAGLSNQVFYRHFRSKDELLLALLDDGQRRLLATLEARMARVALGVPRVRAWVEGVVEQARRPDAADNTRPFVVNGLRLADRFTVEWSRLHEALLAPLRAAIIDAGGNPERDAPAIYHLAFGTMQAALVRRTRPSQADVDHVVECSVAIVERTQRMTPGGRSDMDTEHGR